MTIGHPFAFSYEDELKSRRELIHLLIDIVGKGGNLALNIGAQPDGRLPLRARERALDLVSWLKEYGEAIFSTRALPPYFEGEWSFTRSAAARYALWRLPENRLLPEAVSLPFPDVQTAEIPGIPAHLETIPDGSRTRVILPERLRGTCPEALVLRLNPAGA